MIIRTVADDLARHAHEQRARFFFYLSLYFGWIVYMRTKFQIWILKKPVWKSWSTINVWDEAIHSYMQ